MDIPTDPWPAARATAQQLASHGADAARALADAARGGTVLERELAAARAMDELDHMVETSRAVPAGLLVPQATAAYAAYDIGRLIVSGITGAPFARKAQPVLGAAQLFAASDHMADALELHGMPNASETERLRAAALLGHAKSDADTGFAMLQHPPAEAAVHQAISAAIASVEARQPIDPAPFAAARTTLERCAREAVGQPVPDPPAAPATMSPHPPPAPSAAPPAAPVPAATIPIPAPQAAPTPLREPAPTPPGPITRGRLDLPRWVPPPIPSFGPPRG